MLKTIVQSLPQHTIVIIYDENFVKRTRALNSLNYYKKKILKKHSIENQMELPL